MPDEPSAERAPAAGLGALELRGPAVGLLDEPLTLQLRGLGGPATDALVWRARMRDDDSRVWRATASWAEQLASAWAPAKSGAGALAALQSLRPVALDVRVEAPDGRSAARTFTRRLLGDGVRVRRWRDGVAATLYLPAAGAPRAGDPGAGDPSAGDPGAGANDPDAPAPTADPVAAVVLDTTAGPDAAVAVPLTAALLASRGVLALAVSPLRGGDASPAELQTAAERLAQVPAAARAAGGVELLEGPLLLPPGIPAQVPDSADARADWWDGLLERLGATPRAAAAR